MATMLSKMDEDALKQRKEYDQARPRAVRSVLLRDQFWAVRAVPHLLPSLAKSPSFLPIGDRAEHLLDESPRSMCM